jgi:hypothetical protein
MALLALMTIQGIPVGAQEDDLCHVLTPEDLAGAVPGTYDAPSGFAGTCQWHGTSSAGEALDVLAYLIPGAASDFAIDPAAVETTVAGFPAITFRDLTVDPPAGAVAVETGGNVILLTVATADPAVDVGAVAVRLVSSAIGRIGEGPDSSSAADGAPVEGSREDPCSLFSAEELSAATGAALSAFADVRSCRWDAADGGTSISVSFSEGGLTTLRTLYPDGEDITVAGQPAYQVDQGFPGLAAWEIDVDLGPDTMSLLVTSTDEQLDISSLARGLIETAFGRGLEVLPEPEPVATACQLATPEAIAEAAGVGGTLTAQDYETACAYEGGKGDKHIVIYVALQEPAKFEMAIEGLGGSEIDGPGDRSWWMADAATLATVQGELALQVTVAPTRELGDAKLQQLARAIMEVLLAP